MSLTITCKQKIKTEIKQEVVNRTLTELKEKYANFRGYHAVKFSYKDNEITTIFDRDFYKKDYFKQLIDTTLAKHEKQFHKEENIRKKKALIRALKRCGLKVQIQNLGRNKIEISGTR